MQNSTVPLERTEETVTDSATIDRRRMLATYCNDGRFLSLQTAADDLSYTSKTAVRNDLLWLEKQGIVHVDRTGKTLNVAVNGRYETFVNG